MEDRQTSQRPTLRNRTTRNGGGFVVWNSVSAFSERKPKQYVTNTLQRQESLIQQFSVFRFLGMNYLISAKFITNNIFLQKKFSSVGSPEFFGQIPQNGFSEKLGGHFHPGRGYPQSGTSFQPAKKCLSSGNLWDLGCQICVMKVPQFTKT